MCTRKSDLKNREGRIFLTCVLVSACSNDHDEKFCPKLGASINF